MTAPLFCYYYILALSLALCELLRIRFLILMLFGVTSRSSSSARNSSESSRLRFLGGTSQSASSEPLARVFVRCFFLQTFTTRSSCFGEAPTIIPSYTGVPAVMNSSPLSCAL